MLRPGKPSLVEQYGGRVAGAVLWDYNVRESQMKKVPEQWLRDGRAQLLPHELSVAFDRYVMSLPWNGTTGLDWTKLPRSEAINVVQASPAEYAAWVARTAIARHSHLAIWYSISEGGLVVETAAGINALDELYGAYVGARFAFGLDVTDGGIIVPDYRDFLQWGHGDLFVAISARPES